MNYLRHRVLAAGLLALGAVAAGILARSGTLTAPRTRRAALPSAHATAHETPGRPEVPRPAAGPDDGLWRAHLGIVEKELQQGRIDVAVRAWHDAYGAALASRGWDGMIAAGDAFMAIGRASGSVRGARMNAREAYLTAFIRARRDRSVDGVLRSAEAFRQLGDQAVVEQCLHVAGELAAGDARAEQRVREAGQPWTSRAAITEF